MTGHRWRGAALALTGLLLLGLAGGAAAQAPRASSTSVVTIYQSTYVTEQENFTVWMQVGNTANIQFVYFTFCQLTNSQCYLPVIMKPHGGGWYVGSTNPMSTYHGMTVGVQAGYNITIDFTDNSTQVEPTYPNPFTNLTLGQTLTGEYMFVMSVSPNVYGLSGVVDDAATGAAVAGASVTLAPGGLTTTTSSSGAYAFSQLVNGSYTVSVSGAGYRNISQPVTIAGGNAVQNIEVSSSSASPGGGGTSNGGLLSVFSGPNAWMVIVPVVVVVVAAGAGLALLRRRRQGPRPPAPEQGSPEGSSGGTKE